MRKKKAKSVNNADARKRIAKERKRRQQALFGLAVAVLGGCGMEEHEGTGIGGSGLVMVRCETCTRPIATTKVDQDKGEPPILLEFPENANGWTCTECHSLEVSA